MFNININHKKCHFFKKNSKKKVFTIMIIIPVFVVIQKNLKKWHIFKKKSQKKSLNDTEKLGSIIFQSTWDFANPSGRDCFRGDFESRVKRTYGFFARNENVAKNPGKLRAKFESDSSAGCITESILSSASYYLTESILSSASYYPPGVLCVAAR